MRRHRIRSAVLVLLATLLATGCLGNDYERGPIDIGLSDSRPDVYVEIDDEFEATMFGHPSYPDAAWEIVAFDDTVVTLEDTIHTPRAGEPPPADMMPIEVGEVYAAIPEDEKYYHVEEGDGTRIWYTPDTRFEFTGGDLGTTAVMFALDIENVVRWTFEFRVTVVEDACEYFVSQGSATKVPHRCG